MISQKNALEIQASLNRTLQIETPPVESTPAALIESETGWRPERYVPPEARVYIEADRLEAARVKRWRDGEDMSNCPAWIAPGIPTCYYAHTLAKEHGISHAADEVFESKYETGIWYACVWTFNPKNQRLQVGAAYWDDRFCAKMFAYRNSIRQQLVGLCLEIGKRERKAWRHSHPKYARRYI